jgi:ethanolamine utilization microcompartment shell protein EutL
MMQAIVKARGLLLASVALSVAAGLALPGSGGAVGSGSAATHATASAKAYFVLGQQLVAVPAPRATIRGAIARLLAGPSTAEIRRGVRSFVPKTVKLEAAASQTGNIATKVVSMPGLPSTRFAGR